MPTVFLRPRPILRRRRWLAPTKTPASGAIAIATPAQYKVFQRSGTTGPVTASGTYSGGVPTAIEVAFSWHNGGAFQTLDAAPSGGNWSGTATGITQGQGTMTVRWANDTGVTATRTNVGVGDVFLVVGDSHNEGRGDSGQSYSHASLKAAKFRQDDAWAEGNDPIDLGTSSGSHFPLLATLIMADQSVPVAFITCATGGTDLNTTGTKNTWSPGNADYLEMQAQVTAAAVGSNGIKAILCSVGGNAMGVDAPSQSVYNTAIDLFANTAATDIPGSPKTVLGLFGDCSDYPRADLDNVRLAAKEAWGNNSNVLPGYNLIDQSYSDDVHARTNAELLVMARRMWPPLKEHFYGGASGYGRGPRVSGTPTIDASLKFITVTFDRDLAAGATYGGFRVENNGSSVSITSATRATSRRVVIELAAAATGTVTVSFGSGGDAAGQTVPTSTAITLPDSNTVTLPAEPFVDQGVTAEGAGGGTVGSIFGGAVIR